MGSEPTIAEFIQKMTTVFREVRRVLRKDGTCWVNMGDCYNAYNGAAGPGCGLSRQTQSAQRPKLPSGYGLRSKELKPKELCGIPWRLAFALSDDGWFLRQDIIWSKPNVMPESIKDRCTKSHEYLFLLTKSARYFWDRSAMTEKVNGTSNPRGPKVPAYWDTSTGNGGHGRIKRNGRNPGVTPKSAAAGSGVKANDSFQSAVAGLVEVRNRRSVWTIPTAPYAEAHFATYPPDLIKPCILAGCPAGGTVLDPFAGSGTTGAVALELGRKALLIELNPAYVELIKSRCDVTPGLHGL